MNWNSIAKTIDPSDRPGRLVGLVVAAVVFAGGFFASPTAAEPVPGEDCAECWRVDALVIEGLLRTRRSVVERELLFDEGDIVTREQLEESAQRLRNTGIFRSVDYRLANHSVPAYDANPGEDPGRVVRLQLEERYTLSPSFRFGRGGDLLHLRVGVHDVNIAGSFLQGGISYSRMGVANSFSAWFRQPRLFGGRQQLQVGGGIDNRVYTLFDEQGDIEGGYLRTRRHARVRVGKEWLWWLRTEAGTAFSANTFSYRMVDDQRRRAQQDRGGLYGPSQTWNLHLNLRLGRIDRDEHLREGTEFDVHAEQNLHFGDLQPRSRRVRTRLLYFQPLVLDATLAARAEVGFRDASASYLQFFAGGLDTVRGTWDNRHRGPHHWLSNVELRVPTFKNDWMILENTVFFDAVGVADELDGLAGLTAATTGVGLRVIARDLHGMVLRVDYAPPVLGADGPGLSFGAGQFF